MQDMRETLLTLGRAIAQSRGYTGLSFRELAKAAGIKSASVHYHFPTKADLGVALARQYCEDTAKGLEELHRKYPEPTVALREYTAIFRRTLTNENRMCMCGAMTAEYDELPDEVRAEVARFNQINTEWLAALLSASEPSSSPVAAYARARAIFAAIGGAQLMARSAADVSVYDELIATFVAVGLIPDG